MSRSNRENQRAISAEPFKELLSGTEATMDPLEFLHTAI